MMKFQLLPLIFIDFVLLHSIALAQAQDPLTDTRSGNWTPKTLSIAYSGENFVRPGMQFSVDFIPFVKNKSELMLSPVATFFGFRPFYTSVMLGGRAMYQLHFPAGFTLRPIGITTSYKHKFLNAPVYEVNNGVVEKISDRGYGNFHLLATTGLAYNFSDRKNLPLSVYTDIGVSAEPYFGVYRFHYEFFLGVSYHWNVRKSIKK